MYIHACIHTSCIHTYSHRCWCWPWCCSVPWLAPSLPLKSGVYNWWHIDALFAWILCSICSWWSNFDRSGKSNPGSYWPSLGSNGCTWPSTSHSPPPNSFTNSIDSRGDTSRPWLRSTFHSFNDQEKHLHPSFIVQSLLRPFGAPFVQNRPSADQLAPSILVVRPGKPN